MPISISLRAFVGIVGAVVVVAAVVLLLTPITAGAEVLRAVDCGTVLTPDYGRGDEVVCDEAIGTRRIWVWALGIVGLLAVVGALFVEIPQVRRPPNAA